ncbi:MAG: hypothetical protein DRI54_09005 [Bacteroidetes bacterium]|nr:MAG: hypothetical protein DRI54_09005 [Bacteroidota bacterium]
MLKTYLTSLFFLLIQVGNAQITINSQDMPAGGDSYLVSRTSTLDFNADDTGENYTWDYSDLLAISQDTVAFDNISDAPTIYQFIFNNPFDPDNKATEGEIKEGLEGLEGFDIENVYLFSNTGDNKKEAVGFGATVNSIPLPVAFDNNRLLYDFPLNYNNNGSDDFNFELEVPNMGFIAQSGSLTYTVDGWGTLITSFGTFEALRIKRIINQYDTVFVSSSQNGIGINREITEYEWLGSDTGIPLLSITTEFGIVTGVIYQDNLLIPVGIEEVKEPISSFSIYPQPARGKFHIGFDRSPQSPIIVVIYDLSGKKIWDKRFEPIDKITIDDTFNKGIYLIDIQIGEFQKVKKLIIQ